MLSAFVITILGVLAVVIVHFRRELSRDAAEYSRKWLLQWAGRGVMAPILAWLIMNVGTMPLMPPLTPGVASGRLAGHWIAALITQTLLAALVIGSCWTAVTCGWFMAALFRRARNNEDLIIISVVWSPLVVPLVWFFLHFGGWSTAGFAALFWLCPMTQYLLMEAQIAKPLPAYSRAIGNIKFGKYGEAEKAIIGQLEKCETDFDGWMMLADLYAHHFDDLAQAEQTILDVCAEPSTTLPQVSMALHRLADWQLQLRHDPVAARRILEEICQRMPGSHLDKMARHRINQLPATGAEWLKQQEHRTVRMPEPERAVEVIAAPAVIPMTREAAAAAANALVEQLEANPKDIEAREELARIFEGSLDKLDFALEQLDLLVRMPGTSQPKAVQWLSLMIEWEIKHRGENEAAQKILLRLIQEFPQSAEAFQAQKRLNLMRSGLRNRRRHDNLAKGQSAA